MIQDLKTGELFSQADLAAALMKGQGTMETRAQTVPVMIRMPLYDLAKIDAMVARSGKSRTGIISLLCSIGLEETFSRLDQSDLETFSYLEAEAFSKLTAAEADSQKVL